MLYVIFSSNVLIFWIGGELFVKYTTILCESAKLMDQKDKMYSIIWKLYYCL